MLIKNIVLTKLVITMKNTKIKHNKNWDWNRDFTKKEKKEFIEKEENRLKRIKRMKPEQKKIYLKTLLNRNQRKAEIKKQIIAIISSQKNLALTDIQKEIGLKRNTFNYWVGELEKEGWLKREPIKHKGIISKQGKPKTLILNKKKIKEMEQYSFERSKKYEDKSFEAYTLTSMFINKILSEIEENPSYKQHQKLIKLFKQFKKEGYGAQSIFLLYSDYIKVDYKFSITDKGKKALRKIKKKSKSKKVFGILQ